MVDQAVNTVMHQYQLQLKLLKIYTDVIMLLKYRPADLIKS